MSQSRISVDGAHLLAGDAGTAKIIFNNLSGKNFSQIPGDPFEPSALRENHAQYLAFMGKSFNLRLNIGDLLQLINPSGHVSMTSTIGGELTTEPHEAKNAPDINRQRA